MKKANEKFTEVEIKELLEKLEEEAKVLYQKYMLTLGGTAVDGIDEKFGKIARRYALKSKLYYLGQKILEYERQLRVAMINLKATETPNKQK